jgi:hypothetical protein
MRTPHIGVATCAAAPDLDEDGPLLLASLAAAGAEVRVGRWDSDDVGWGSLDTVLIRSTWDYPLRREAFLEWTRRCRRTANPQDVVAWNTDKRYLDDLAAGGVPTVPTVFVDPGSPVPAAATGWREHVVKPAVSGSAADTGRFAGLDDPGAVALMTELHRQNRTVMVQPYLDGIDVDGEISLVFLGGQYSHAVRRAPLLLDRGVRTPVVVADVLSTVDRTQPSETELAVATAALAAVPGGAERLTYARVDLIPGPTGPLLLELEATDCFLFLAFASVESRDRLSRHLLGSISRAEGSAP